MLSLTVPKIPTRSTKRRAPRANDPPVVTTVPPRNDLAQGVATGAIGGDYDPYAAYLFAPDAGNGVVPSMPRRNDLAQSVTTDAIGGDYDPYADYPLAVDAGNDVVPPIPPRNDLSQSPYAYNPSAADAGNRDGVYLASRYNTVPSERSSTTGHRHAPPANSSTVPAYLWDTKDPDPNDALHYPKPPWAALRKARRSEVAQTLRGEGFASHRYPDSTSSTPTAEASHHVYSRGVSFRDASITSSDISETDSRLSGATSTSIASYKSEKSINSRKSRYNALPRHKYAGLEHLRPPPGPVSSDVGDTVTSVLKTESQSNLREKCSTSITTTERSTIDETLESAPVGRFRIVLVGQSGVGKSSLINRVFDVKHVVTDTTLSSDVDVYRELASHENKYLDFRTFKVQPRDLSDHEILRSYLEETSLQTMAPMHSKNRVHCLWLCIETPVVWSRVFETGHEKLLEFVQGFRGPVPTVIVFTKYDLLVSMMRENLKEDHPNMDKDSLDSQSEEEALNAFEKCLESLRQTMGRFRIPMPPYARVSVRPGFQENISELVEVTQKAVKEKLPGDAWIMWTIAQRANPFVKMEASVRYGMNGFIRHLPSDASISLRNVVMEIHKDVITFWNFKQDRFEDEILHSEEFKQLMLYLVQDVIDVNQPQDSAPQKISQFVNLVTADTTSILPPVVILGFTSQFVQWFSFPVLVDEAPVQRLLFAYTVDLICILRELSDITLRPNAELTATWPDLKEALETYERSSSRRHIHNSIRSYSPRDGQILTANDLSNKIRELLSK